MIGRGGAMAVSNIMCIKLKNFNIIFMNVSSTVINFDVKKACCACYLGFWLLILKLGRSYSS